MGEEGQLKMTREGQGEGEHVVVSSLNELMKEGDDHSTRGGCAKVRLGPSQEAYDSYAHAADIYLRAIRLIEADPRRDDAHLRLSFSAHYKYGLALINKARSCPLFEFDGDYLHGYGANTNDRHLTEEVEEDLDLGMEMLCQALTIADNNNFDTEEKAHICSILGEDYAEEDNYKQAVPYILKAISIYEAVGGKEIDSVRQCLRVVCCYQIASSEAHEPIAWPGFGVKNAIDCCKKAISICSTVLDGNEDKEVKFERMGEHEIRWIQGLKMKAEEKLAALTGAHAKDIEHVEVGSSSVDGDTEPVRPLILI